MSKLDEKLQRVYRLEYAATGKGMYTKLKGAKWMGAAHRVLKEDPVRHQGPYDDHLLVSGMDEKELSLGYFGFSSIKALRKWVRTEKELLGLHGYGIKLAVYVCPREKVIEGTKQLMFYESVRKRQYDIKKYFNIE